MHACADGLPILLLKKREEETRKQIEGILKEKWWHI